MWIPAGYISWLLLPPRSSSPAQPVPPPPPQRRPPPPPQPPGSPSSRRSQRCAPEPLPAPSRSAAHPARVRFPRVRERMIGRQGLGGQQLAGRERAAHILAFGATVPTGRRSQAARSYIHLDPFPRWERRIKPASKSSAACTGTIWTTVSHLLDDGEVDLAQRLSHHRTLPLLAALLLHLPCTVL